MPAASALRVALPNPEDEVGLSAPSLRLLLRDGPAGLLRRPFVKPVNAEAEAARGALVVVVLQAFGNPSGGPRAPETWHGGRVYSARPDRLRRQSDESPYLLLASATGLSIAIVSCE